MQRQNDMSGLVIFLGVLIVLAGMGGGFYLLTKASTSLAGDTQTVVIDIPDISEPEPIVDDPDPVDDSDEPPPEPKEEDDDDTTYVVEPEPEPEPTPIQPPQKDRSLSGEMTVDVDLIGVSGNPLSVLPLSFTKTSGGEEVEEIKINYQWDFQLGKDLDKDTFRIYITGDIEKIYWNGLIDTYRSGTLQGGEVWRATGFDAVGWSTKTLPIDDPKLRFINVEYETDNAIVYTTQNSFKVKWEMEVKDTDGITYTRSGYVGVALALYYDDDSYGFPIYEDPDGFYDYYYGGYYYDPYSQSPLMSIVNVG